MPTSKPSCRKLIARHTLERSAQLRHTDALGQHLADEPIEHMPTRDGRVGLADSDPEALALAVADAG